MPTTIGMSDAMDALSRALRWRMDVLALGAGRTG
jgi:hypothetical protein